MKQFGHDPGQVVRDIRFDVCRGIALWFIFLNHIPHNIASWATISRYGFSDTTELFMFVSGATCALAYGQVWRQSGWAAVAAHTIRRSWEIYSALLILTLACALFVHFLGEDRLYDETNTRVWFENPGSTIWRAAILEYRPVNTDVLPTFVLFHLFFGPLLWLLEKMPNVALGASMLLYVLVQLFGWNLPEWPTNSWFFNPFAWQLLVVLGAWWAIYGRRTWKARLRSNAVVVGAVLYLAFAFAIAMSWSFEPLGNLVPSALARLLYPIDKSDLDPLRVMHFLAIAIIVLKFVPRDWKVLTTPILVAAVKCGENSLEIYCISVLLSLAGHALLIDVSSGIWMQFVVSSVGIAILIASGVGLTWLKRESRSREGLF